MRKVFHVAVVLFALSWVGCATGDWMFDPSANPGGKSRAQEAGEAVSLFAGPYGDIILGSILAAQNIYLGGKKLKERNAKKRNAT